MKKFKIGIMLAAVAAMGMCLCGCGKEKKDNETSELTTGDSAFMESAEALPEVVHDGVYNDLTGEWNTDRTEEYGRPISVMINNISEAIPQSDVGKADIIYEFKVEGGITRLLGIYSDYSKIEKLGSIRSCRPYYVTVSNEFDAIYVHYGQSPQGQEELDKTGIDHISGLSAEGNVAFYRASDKVAPHNVYTTGEMIQAGIDYIKCDTEHYHNFKSMFKFNEGDKTPEGGDTAKTVKLAISNYTQPYFEYNESDGLYYRFQYGAEHVDELTGEQLTFKNIIIQFAHYTSIDDHDRQLIDLVGSGDGYYISDGVVIPIKWEKSSDNAQTKFTTEDGKALKLNPGKTYVNVFEKDNKDGVTWE